MPSLNSDSVLAELRQIDDVVSALQPHELAPDALLARRYELRKALAQIRASATSDARSTTDAGTAFAIMPFHSPFNEYYAEVIKPATLDAGFVVTRSDEIFSPGVFIQTIWEQVLVADAIIAEMTGANSNVLYELGLSHAVAKKVIMLTQNLNDVPADLRHFNCIVYDTTKVNWAEQTRNALQRMLLFQPKSAKPVLDPPASIDNTTLFQELLEEQQSLNERFDNATLRLTTAREEIDALRVARDSANAAANGCILTTGPQTSASIYEENGDRRAALVVPGSTEPLTLVYVPPGPFLFGAGRNHEQLDLRGYWITQYSITNSHYCAFLNAVGNQSEDGVPWVDLDGKSPADRCRLHYADGRFDVEASYENHPVTYVNYYGAAAFCAWLGGELPTVQQWEKAVRGVDGRDYPWGSQPPTSDVANLGEEGWAREVAPIAVNLKPQGASLFGVVQGIGNVWHWTSTYFPDRDVQAVRGGSFFDFRLGKREVYRFQAHPDGPDFSQGLLMVKRFLVSLELS
jgi:formylglycine-generating enzyme required for sulfatase activity